jgi:hypothetical protein
MNIMEERWNLWRAKVVIHIENLLTNLTGSIKNNDLIFSLTGIATETDENSDNPYNDDDNYGNENLRRNDSSNRNDDYDYKNNPNSYTDTKYVLDLNYQPIEWLDILELITELK